VCVGVCVGVCWRPLPVRTGRPQVLAPHWCAEPRRSAEAEASRDAAGGAAPNGQFAIWGAGRDGRNFYNGLQPEYRARLAQRTAGGLETSIKRPQRVP